MEAAFAYDEAAKTMFKSCARLNFPAGLDSMTTSNNSVVFAISPYLGNEATSVVKNEAGKGELRANAQHSVVAEANTACSTIQEDGISDLDDIGEHFNDDFFSSIESLFNFDFDAGYLGFLGDDQCGKPLLGV